jgi:di/tricarboxylate transporter
VTAAEVAVCGWFAGLVSVAAGLVSVAAGDWLAGFVSAAAGLVSVVACVVVCD